MEYGCVYFFVGRRSTTQQKRQQQQQHILESRRTCFFSYSYSLLFWGFCTTTSTTMLIQEASYTHTTLRCRYCTLQDPVEVTFSMTRRVVHRQAKRGNVYTGDHVGRFPWCCRVGRFYWGVWSIHAETARPRVKKSRRLCISLNGKWKRRFCIRTRYVYIPFCCSTRSRCATFMKFSSIHPVSTATQSTTITEVSQSKGQN